MFKISKNVGNKLVNFRTRKKIVPLVTLSDDRAIEWLKDNIAIITDYSRNFDFQGEEDWRVFVEYSWYRRKSNRLRFALAQYGCTGPTLKRLKKHSKYRKILLANALAYPEDGFIKGGVNIFSGEEIRSIFDNWSRQKDEFLIIFTNEKLSRDFIYETLSSKKVFKKENEEQICAFIACVAENPVLKETLPTDARYDWHAESTFDRLEKTFLHIITEAPVTENWAFAIQRLMECNPYMYSPRKIDPKKFAKKWADSPQTKKERYLKPEYLVRAAFWKFYIRNFHHVDLPINVENEYPEALEVMIRHISPADWLANFIDKDDFEPPIFDRGRTNRLFYEDKQKSKETLRVKSVIETLFEKGVSTWSFVESDHFYINEKRRILLSNIIDGFDESITDWELVARRRDELAETNPEYFEEDSEGTVDDETWLRRRTDEIKSDIGNAQSFSIFIHSAEITEWISFAGVDSTLNSNMTVKLCWHGERIGGNHSGYSKSWAEFFKPIFSQDDQNLASLNVTSHDVEISPISDDRLPILNISVDIRGISEHPLDYEKNLTSIKVNSVDEVFEAIKIELRVNLGLRKDQYLELKELCENKFNPSDQNSELIRLDIYTPEIAKKFERSFRLSKFFGPEINYRLSTTNFINEVFVKRSAKIGLTIDDHLAEFDATEGGKKVDRIETKVDNIEAHLITNAEMTNLNVIGDKIVSLQERLAILSTDLVHKSKRNNTFIVIAIILLCVSIIADL